MVHKMDKDLPTVISTIKGLGLFLQKSVSHQFFRIGAKGTRSSWTLIKSLLMSTSIGVSMCDFRTLLPCALYYFFGAHPSPKGGKQSEFYIVDVGKEIVHSVQHPPRKPNDEESEDDESYDVSCEDEPSTTPCHPGHPLGLIGRDYRVHSPVCGRIGVLEGTHRSAISDVISSFLDSNISHSSLRCLPKEGATKKGRKQLKKSENENDGKVTMKRAYHRR
ncbi:hypothetical protein M9H77_07884 [Catharanthus roseus]|uniref:Uncharacterized protein n=1 Tax=Catharanthus roseus TaxID=4058 RepID=A0ACC0BWH9_CATRO|nr:hypothetical protein M9H77_07884 [Catharanthus roseus]